MTGGGDARGAMDVAADVALVGEQRRAGMQADPHLDLPGGERLRHLGGSRERTRRRGEREEEGVSLGVDLDAAVASAGLADHASVLGERLRVRLRAELVQKASSSPRRR